MTWHPTPGWQPSSSGNHATWIGRLDELEKGEAIRRRITVAY